MSIIGTWYGITPYVGAGIGGAWVEWDDLNNTLDDGSFTRHRGGSDWRFAYALSAGASYCLTEQLKFDAGYRFSHIQGGKMFEFAAGTAGPGYDDGIYAHEVRGGLRYQFGKSDCADAGGDLLRGGAAGLHEVILKHFELETARPCAGRFCVSRLLSKIFGNASLSLTAI